MIKSKPKMKLITTNTTNGQCISEITVMKISASETMDRKWAPILIHVIITKDYLLQ